MRSSMNWFFHDFHHFCTSNLIDCLHVIVDELIFKIWLFLCARLDWLHIRDHLNHAFFFSNSSFSRAKFDRLHAFDQFSYSSSKSSFSRIVQNRNHFLYHSLTFLHVNSILFHLSHHETNQYRLQSWISIFCLHEASMRRVFEQFKKAFAQFAQNAKKITANNFEWNKKFRFIEFQKRSIVIQLSIDFIFISRNRISLRRMRFFHQKQTKRRKTFQQKTRHRSRKIQKNQIHRIRCENCFPAIFFVIFDISIICRANRCSSCKTLFFFVAFDAFIVVSCIFRFVVNKRTENDVVCKNSRSSRAIQHDSTAMTAKIRSIFFKRFAHQLYFFINSNFRHRRLNAKSEHWQNRFVTSVSTIVQK